MRVLLDNADVGIDSLLVTPWQRLAARAFACRLDELLATGASPESSVLLAVRAHDLVTDRHRCGLATAMDRIVSEATDTGSRRGTAIPVNWDAVLVAEADLRELAERLRTPAPVPARGVALVDRLLTDGKGPLFNPARAAELLPAARRASRMLDPSALW